MSRVRMYEDDDASSVVSLGQNLEKRAVWTADNPRYQAFSAKLQQHLTEIIERERHRRERTPSTILTNALSTEQLARVAAVYPEFDVRVWPTHSPGHSEWVALRKLGNLWMCQMVMKIAGSRFSHWGGDPFQAMLHGMDYVHLEHDEESPVLVHEEYESVSACLRLSLSPIKLATDYGIVLSERAYEDFTQLKKWDVCRLGCNCAHTAGAAVFDLSTSFLSPVQVAAAMLQSGAQMAYVMLPYTHELLVRPAGHSVELDHLGVSMMRTDGDVVIQYPEGISGVVRVPLRDYSAWLANHDVSSFGDGSVYTVELMKVRGPFLFARVVKLEGRVASEKRFHALDLPNAADKTLVQVSILSQIAADPADDDSWERREVLVSTRVLQRAREHALSLKPEDFTRLAVRKRLQIANNRFVVQGTSVVTEPELSSEHLDLLEVAIYADVFEVRYQMGALGKQLMASLRKASEFGSMSVASRLCFLIGTFWHSFWESTGGTFLRGLGEALDKYRRWLGVVPKERPPRFMKPPEFIMLNSKAVSQLVMKGNLWTRAFDALQVCPSDKEKYGGWFLYGFGRATGVQGEQRANEVAQVVMSASCTQDLQVLAESKSEPLVDEILSSLSQTTEVGKLSETSRAFEVSSYEPVPPAETVESYDLDPQYVETLDRFHEAVCPGMAGPEYAYDSHSLSLDDQARSMTAVYLKAPRVLGSVPVARKYYLSLLKAYPVPKRQMTTQEMLSAVASRNLSAPVLAAPQSQAEVIVDVWNNFLDVMCVEGARAKLAGYRASPVSLDEENYRAWAAKATPDSLAKIRADLSETAKSFEDMKVEDYVAMLKADVKPPVGRKPVASRVEPQVIVYHEKPLSSLYSSVFRMLVQRFLSLLKPNIVVNLTKDMESLRQLVEAFHPWGKSVRYLENDFSKYDKSQDQFVFELEAYMFAQLGLDEELLSKWLDGHVKCNIRCVSLGLSLVVDYQRKSGDATTAFGNGMLNVVSVAYAYRGTKIDWGLFQGDDSLVCASTIAQPELAVRILAEVFNLSAKFYITDAPYFASNFLLLQDDLKEVSFVPDPLKRVEKWSQMVPADDPQWEERYQGHLDSCRVYLHREKLVGLEAALALRYAVGKEEGFVGVAGAVASAVSSFTRFRAMWREEAELVGA